MNRSRDMRLYRQAVGERGGARLKLLIVLALIGMIAYAGYQYVPVAYNAYLFQDYMQDRVNYAVMTDKPDAASWVERELRGSSSDYDVPSTAAISVQVRDGRIEARVQYIRPIPLPGYVYHYNFDHTVRSNSSLRMR